MCAAYDFSLLYNVYALFSRATKSLIGPNKWIDTILQAGRVGMFEIIKMKWSEWNLKEHGNLLKDLKRRGVAKDGVLPNYRYRDDAILLWKAVEKYVIAVVNNVYGKHFKYYTFCYIFSDRKMTAVNRLALVGRQS